MVHPPFSAATARQSPTSRRKRNLQRLRLVACIGAGLHNLSFGAGFFFSFLPLSPRHIPGLLLPLHLACLVALLPPDSLSVDASATERFVCDPATQSSQASTYSTKLLCACAHGAAPFSSTVASSQDSFQPFPASCHDSLFACLPLFGTTANTSEPCLSLGHRAPILLTSQVSNPPDLNCDCQIVSLLSVDVASG